MVTGYGTHVSVSTDDQLILFGGLYPSKRIGWYTVKRL